MGQVINKRPPAQRAAGNCILFLMIDEPRQRGEEDGGRVATIGEVAVHDFVEAIQVDLPLKTDKQVKAALELALEQTHCATTEGVLKEKVAAILGRAKG